MADEPKKPEVPPEKRPLENPKVDVSVTPNRRGDRDHARKVGEQLQKDVREAVEKSAGDGHKKQLEKAREVVEEKARQINPERIHEIEVEVSGRVGKKVHGDVVTVQPKEPGSGKQVGPIAPPEKRDGKKR